MRSWKTLKHAFLNQQSDQWQRNFPTTETLLTISSSTILRQTSWKTAEICQLSVVDQLDLHCFNNYILPLRDVEIHATRVNSLSVQTVRGIRTLFKGNQPVETVSLGKSLENFLSYLEKTVRRVKCDRNIYTVLIRHNSQVFDTPTLLRQGGHQLCENTFLL